MRGRDYDYSVRSQILRKMAKMQFLINNEQLTINKVRRAADFVDEVEEKPQKKLGITN